MINSLIHADGAVIIHGCKGMLAGKNGVLSRVTSNNNNNKYLHNPPKSRLKNHRKYRKASIPSILLYIYKVVFSRFISWWRFFVHLCGPEIPWCLRTWVHRRRRHQQRNMENAPYNCKTMNRSLCAERIIEEIV
jgi:hypothetical protein